MIILKGRSFCPYCFLLQILINFLGSILDITPLIMIQSNRGRFHFVGKIPMNKLAFGLYNRFQTLALHFSKIPGFWGKKWWFLMLILHFARKPAHYYLLFTCFNLSTFESLYVGEIKNIGHHPLLKDIFVYVLTFSFWYIFFVLG